MKFIGRGNRSGSAFITVTIILCIAGASASCVHYHDAPAGSKLASARVGMGANELRDTVGGWTDTSKKHYPYNWLPWLVMSILHAPIAPFVPNEWWLVPPVTGQCFHYRAEGRVYLRRGWFVGSHLRVYSVKGDTAESGYK